MKRMLPAVLIFAAGMFSIGARVGRSGEPAPQPGSPEPWHVGQCYRVFPQNRDLYYHFRVLEAPGGAWVRVRIDLAERPGVTPQAPFWLNSNSTFAAQEWKCAQ